MTLDVFYRIHRLFLLMLMYLICLTYIKSTQYVYDFDSDSFSKYVDYAFS